ncbi:KEOPS complex subunit Pcc1 [Methanobrevibacter ruminantium]|uniref:KEOPS complex subunit Pcc1 n=2 Tax=Methanobrevibacter ruminantium TaxID=83816 RepID=UPI002D7E9DE1|nr:KEOPS complex subunit Pcc1 [Methanobrevibacter ruminantium]
MNIKSNIKMEYKDSQYAEIVYKSLEVDNEGFVQSVLDGNVINFKIESDKLGSFLATADDLIASEILAEEIMKKTNEKDISK